MKGNYDNKERKDIRNYKKGGVSENNDIMNQATSCVKGFDKK